MNDISEHYIVSDTVESLQQHVANDTLKESEQSKSIQKMNDESEQYMESDPTECHAEKVSIDKLQEVSAHHMESATAKSFEVLVASDTLKDNASQESNYGIKDARVAVDNIDQGNQRRNTTEQSALHSGLKKWTLSWHFLKIRTGSTSCHSRTDDGMMRDCGVFLAIFAEYLSDGISIPTTGLYV
ncbi:uncharacterized protein LOC129899064 isoform X2 [Solanum dulcamara]|uniref:uncharacterized protein LOC129899064 isoform X2 n=1 Tax=Solanum dulcamara TaxID=45834 RepID=UPI0024851A1F|nr:uncharacterized protein LOC129899064 isoform X2 [Solanum dulcamara]XP_055829821.1 uncharacterized protein LOC129899064 isoform X2 [Solanum dulcamara]XP_055829822.1 uncharacterized protein LOC129899064 isoform X2 [Solanum dulcamara]XP_055829823.1 uncharacterized protein LOC129899064 isoform X2 [Solanum dulcamara]XP_055829824.1 uncharacterized protein LOC129899064 isoform X2 [Solanum dulcamara]XP_055829825.1 uncharacterized protein LOC129899064 isoform X2 [Solanum dulcamara]